MATINPDELVMNGWQVVEPPTAFSPEMYEYFLNMFGAEKNYHVLSKHVYQDRGDIFVRCVLLVSPEGIEEAEQKSKWYQTKAYD